MLRLACAIHDGARANLGRFAVTVDFARPIGDDHDLFFRMPVRRVRSGPGIENAHAGTHSIELIGGAVIVQVDGGPAFEDRRAMFQLDHAILQLRSSRFGGYNIVHDFICFRHRPIIKRKRRRRVQWSGVFFRLSQGGKAASYWNFTLVY